MAALLADEYCPWCDTEGCPRCGRDTIQNRFNDFHAANPQVYTMLVSLAREWRQAHPNRQVGIARLVEIVRWEMDIKVAPTGDGFKINNNFRSRYARKIMEENSELAGIFEVRELQTK